MRRCVMSRRMSKSVMVDLSCLSFDRLVSVCVPFMRTVNVGGHFAWSCSIDLSKAASWL